MKQEDAAGPDDPLLPLLAALDDALASGDVHSSVDSLHVPDQLRPQLERDAAWCRMVRRLLPEAAASTAAPVHAVPAAASGTPRLSSLGRFRIHRELGRGGFGVVLLARDPKLGRDVALKIPRPEALVIPELRARFQHEARAAASLDHPNLVPVYEAGEADGICYIASAFCPGITLSQWLRERTEPVPVALAARLVATLAEGVEHAHRRGVLHRDLKPSNVILSPRAAGDSVHMPAGGGQLDFVPRIMDFGLAKVLQDEAATITVEAHTQTGAILGTPSYMAPEQAGAQSGAIGPATDVYALGGILYEVLTGRPPFRGDTPVETLLQLQTQDAVAPGRLRPGLPRDLETICLRSLDKDPCKRYASAQALADDLHRYLNRLPIKARRIGALGRCIRWCQRKPALAATIALACLAVGVVAGVGVYQVLQERERYRQERDRAQANLYRALVGEARAVMQARDTGWWWKAMDNIRQASMLEVAERDPAELRELAIECIGIELPCMRLHGTWSGHAGTVTSVAVSPDGRLAATASKDGTARLWSVPAGRPLAVLAGHTEALTGVAFHPQGDWLATSSADGTVRLWKLTDVGHGSESSAAAATYALQGGKVNGLVFSADGAVLAAACAEGALCLLTLDPVTGCETGKRRALQAQAGAATCLAFGKRGQLVAGYGNQTIRVWDSTAEQQTEFWAVNSVPSAIVIDAAVGLAIWSTPENYGVMVRNFPGDKVTAANQIHTGAVRHVVAGPRGRFFTASADGSVKYWRHDTAGRRQELAVARGTWGEVRAVASNAEATWVVAGYADGQARLWQVASPDQRVFLPSDVQRVAFVGAGRTLVNGALHDLTHGWNGPVTPLGPGAIRALAVHPAGDWFAYADDTGHVTIGDRSGRREPLNCLGHREAVQSLESAADGKHLASASADGSVKLWDWETGACRLTLTPGVGAVTDLAWRADGRHLAIAGARGIAVWDRNGPAACRPIRKNFHNGNCVAVIADLLAVNGPGGAVDVCDLHTGRPLFTLHGHEDAVTALRFSPDGARLASAGRDRTIRVWDSKARTEWAVLKSPDNVASTLSFDPQGRFLAGNEVIWDLRTKAPAVRLVFNPQTRFAENGAGLFVGTNMGSIEFCPIADVAKAVADTQPSTKLASFVPVNLSPTSTLVQGGHERIWAIAASPDGRWIATGGHDSTVKLWDARNSRLVRTLLGHVEPVWCVAFSSDSQYVAGGSSDAHAVHGAVKVWEVATGRERWDFRGHTSMVRGVAFHPNQPWLVSVAGEGDVCLWDVGSGKSLGTLHRLASPVHGVAFRPDGRVLAAACHDGRIAVWEFGAVPPGAPPTRILEAHTAGVQAVEFSADGRYLASGSNDGVIVLWDAQTLTRITKLRGGHDQIRGVAFSRDGELLAGGAFFGKTVVWDLSRLRHTLADMNLDW